MQLLVGVVKDVVGRVEVRIASFLFSKYRHIGLLANWLAQLKSHLIGQWNVLLVNSMTNLANARICH